MSDETGDVAARGGLDRLLTLIVADLRALDQPDDDGYAALHYAAGSGNAELARALLDLGADINVRNARGDTPLHMARDAAVASVLMQRKADVHAVDESGWTPLHAAAFRGAADVIRALVDGGADANARDPYGNAPLHLTFSLHHRDCLRLLAPLMSEAGINAQGGGSTPLRLASLDGDAGIVKLLLDHGADPNVPSKTAYSNLVYPLGSTLWSYHEEVAEMLLRAGGNPDHAMYELNKLYAVSRTDISNPDAGIRLPARRSLLSLLLRYGLDCSRAVPDNQHGDTLLHTLCWYEAPVSDIKLMLDHDHTLVSIKNGDGDTPLQVYVKKAGTLRVGVVKALLEAGADATLGDGGGRPLLNLRNRHPRIPDGVRQLLVDHGAHDGCLHPR